MGKTRTAVVSGAPEPKAKKKERKKHKKSLREEKGVRIPGLKGGERIVAVDSAPPPEKIEKKEEEKTEKKEVRPPKKRGKKYKEALAKVDRKKLHPLSDAIKLVKESSYSRFDGTVELHMVVNKRGFSTRVELPHPSGQKKKVEIASDKTLEKLKKGNVDFDVLLATPEMMPLLVPFAKVLGPKGLMPNPKTGTLIKNAQEAEKFSGNALSIKTEKKQPLIHTTIGKVNQKEKELAENTEAIISAIGKRQIKKAILSATMGPGIKLKID